MSGKMIYFHTMGTFILLTVAGFAVWRIVRNYVRDTQPEWEEGIVSDITDQTPVRVEPSSKLVIDGFYIYTDESGTKTLRDAEGLVLLDFTVERVVYDHGNHCLVCYLSENRGIWLYYPEDQRKIFRAYCRLELKTLNNQYHIYSSTNKSGIGILDNNYTELTRTKYTSVKMFDENYFLAEEPKGGGVAQTLIDLKGKEILKNIQQVFGTFRSADKILVKDLQDKYFFFDLSDHSIVNLPYKWIWLCTAPKGKARVSDIAEHLLRAMKETDEVFEGYTLKRQKGTILDQEGKALFPPKYDSIEFLEQGDQVHFEVGLGEEQLWDHLSEEGFEHFDGSGFKPMLYGIIDATDNVIIPIAYTEIFIVKEQFYQVNKGGTLHFYKDCIQPYYDEPFWSWEIKGGKYGLYNSKGELLLPAEYEELYAPFNRQPADFVSVKEGQQQYWKIDGACLVPIPDGASGSNL